MLKIKQTTTAGILYCPRCKERISMFHSSNRCPNCNKSLGMKILDFMGNEVPKLSSK